jgi:hypothetical protein
MRYKDDLRIEELEAQEIHFERFSRKTLDSIKEVFEKYVEPSKEEDKDQQSVKASSTSKKTT